MDDLARLNFVLNLKTYLKETVARKKEESRLEAAEVARAKADQIRSMRSGWKRKARGGPNAFVTNGKDYYEGNQYESAPKPKREKTRPEVSS